MLSQQVVAQQKPLLKPGLQERLPPSQVPFAKARKSELRWLGLLAYWPAQQALHSSQRSGNCCAALSRA